MRSAQEFMQIGAVALGIDIGSSAIKAAELRRTRRGIELFHFGLTPTPRGAVEGGLIRDQGAVARAVSTLLKQSRIGARRAVISVAGQNVLARALLLPPIPDEEVRPAMKWEAERHLPFPVEEAVLDVQTVREVFEGGYRRKEVLLAAAPEKLVLALIEAVQAAQVFVEAVEVGALAMARALDRTGKGIHALVNLGASNSEVAIVRDGVVQFTRAISVAGDQITQAVARHLGLDAAKAEEVKMRRGMGLDAAASDDTMASYATEVGAVLEELVTQLRRSLDFYRAQFSGVRIDGIILCGGGARLRHIDHHLTSELEVPATIGTPFTEVHPSASLDQKRLREIAPQLAVATGLALRTVT